MFGPDWIEMKFRLKEGSHGSTSTHEAYAHETLAEFVDSLITQQRCTDLFPRQPGWTYDILCRRQSLIQLVEHLEENGEMVTVGEMFRGGETIHWRIYDETGQEMEDFTVEDYERRIGRRITNPESREVMAEVLALLR
ncbi:hypothetical protein TWF696_001110 [Orbilia brochopaga]|uniref:Uncharacterized protein n=1 Tax=Orbilia brochopaga TaxID=3140254 RepID=A0AAV9VFQ0_9PEZI